MTLACLVAVLIYLCYLLCQSVLVCCFEFIMAIRFCYHQNYPEMHFNYFGRSYPIWSIINEFFISTKEIVISGLRQFLATKSPLKMMKKVFYFTSKTFFILKVFEFKS